MTIGWVATVAACCMYFSYIDQINLNLSGHFGSRLQPVAAVLNCSLWTYYGWCKKDKAVVIGNFPGILLAAATIVTSFYHG